MDLRNLLNIDWKSLAELAKHMAEECVHEFHDAQQLIKILEGKAVVSDYLRQTSPNVMINVPANYHLDKKDFDAVASKAIKDGKLTVEQYNLAAPMFKA